MNKKFTFFLLMIVFLLIGSIIFFYQKQFSSQNQNIDDKKFFSQVNFLKENEEKIASFKVEIASTSAQHEKGLMNRSSLPQNQGMLFIYSQEQQLSFWMKNTLIPLDIIYISKDKKVVSISKNTPPCINDPCPSYFSQKSAQYVLEINGDLANKLGIKEGTKVEFMLH